MRAFRFARSARSFAVVALLALAGTAAAEPPSRAARLGYASGTVSFSPAGQPDWVRAGVNRPLTTGDRLWTGADSRAELQLGGAAIRLGARTSVRILNLDDRIAQFEVTQGTLKLRVRQLGPGQSFEVATPNLALTLRRAGEYRVEVDADDDATEVTVRSGGAEVYGEGAAYAVDTRGGYRFYGVGLDDYDVVAVRPDSDLDRWSRDRDRRAELSPTARYVSTEVVGYEELDGSGVWRTVPEYGPVWTPSRVPAGWTPYRDGHWAWIDPWGWTWVDDAPWGYAVSHYGRWANLSGSWAWVPGPRRERAVYAPALVAFVGGGRSQQATLSVTVSNIAVGWFPLAPREVYRPSYPVSRDYFDSINRSNAVIAPTTITNVYNTTTVTNVTNVVQVVYANRQVPGAVVAVPAQVFAQAQPVARAMVAIPRDRLVAAPVAYVAPVAPAQQSVQGGAAAAVAKPPVREQPVVARTAPPPPPVPFAAQQQQLAAKPGVPIGDTQRAQLKAAPAVAAASAAATAPAPVSVVSVVRVPAPNQAPPASAPAARSPEARRAAVDAGGASGPRRRREDDKAIAAPAAASRAGADATKTDAAKAAAAKTDAVKAEAAGGEAAKADAAKADAAKAQAAKAADAKSATTRADAAKTEAAKSEAAKQEAARQEAARAADAKAAVATAEAAKADAAKAESVKVEAARVEAAKVETARAATAKAVAASGAAARVDAAKADAVRAETARAEATRAEGARAGRTKADAGKADAGKA
ncbi:MAG: DUF6600 domain-containing protein, partial [Caldimonas sp.]